MDSNFGLKIPERWVSVAYWCWLQDFKSQIPFKGGLSEFLCHSQQYLWLKLNDVSKIKNPKEQASKTPGLGTYQSINFKVKIIPSLGENK